MPTIIAAVVDDDGRLTNAGRAKPIKGVANQGASVDRRHWLADAVSVGAQASPVASGNDSPAQDKRVLRAGHVRMSRRSGSSVTEARTAPVSSAIAFMSLDVFWRNPDEAHTGTPRALIIAPQGIADHHSRLRLSLQLRECGLKNRRVGLFGANALTVRHGPK